MDESSRWHRSGVERNINLPNCSRWSLTDRGMQREFQFAFEKADEKVDIPKSAAFRRSPDDALVVTFHETQSRTMVILATGQEPAGQRPLLAGPRDLTRLRYRIGIDDLWLKADIFVHTARSTPSWLYVPVEM